MTTRLHIVFLASLVIAFCPLIGCSGGGALSGLAPVEGIVTHNGNPVEGATVVFAPKNASNSSRSASAITDKNGTFKMMTLQPADGVQPDEYYVAISKKESYLDGKPYVPIVAEGIVDDDKSASKQIDKDKIVWKDVVPSKYGTAKSSGLEIVVSAAGDRQVKFELTD